MQHFHCLAFHIKCNRTSIRHLRFEYKSPLIQPILIIYPMHISHTVHVPKINRVRARARFLLRPKLTHDAQRELFIEHDKQRHGRTTRCISRRSHTWTRWYAFFAQWLLAAVTFLCPNDDNRERRPSYQLLCLMCECGKNSIFGGCSARKVIIQIQKVAEMLQYF